MSSTTQSASRIRSVSSISQGWIIDRQTDVWLIIGPAAIGYLFLYLNVALGISSFLIWWFWQVSVNGAHFFATLSRTFFDRAEWRERGGVLLASLLWIGFGPLVLLLDEELNLPWILPSFVFFQLGWAYFHVVRQHYGLFCLYQKKNQEASGRRNRFDYWLFNIAMFGPFVVWILRQPHYLVALHVTDILAESAVEVLGVLLFASVLFLLARAVADGFRNGRFNLPKMAFFSAYFSLHTVLAMFVPAPYAFDLLLLNAVVTYPHNVQYMAIVWHYNKNHYEKGSQKFGPAALINHNFLRFFLLSLLFGVVYFYGSWYLEGVRVPLMVSISNLAWTPLWGHTVGEFVRMIALGIVFNHYFLDQKIWRVNRDAKVAKDLGAGCD